VFYACKILPPLAYGELNVHEQEAGPKADEKDQASHSAPQDA